MLPICARCLGGLAESRLLDRVRGSTFLVDSSNCLMKEFIRLAGVYYEGSLMAILKSVVVPKNSGAAFEVRNRQRLRIAGKSIVDFVAFNRHDLTERFDQARTKTNQVKIFISTGDILYSKRNNPMLTIVEDTFKEGRHDLQKGMCSRKRFEMVAQGISKRVFAEGVDINPKTAEEVPDHGCWENLSSAVKPWNISPMTCRARSIYFSTCALMPTPASCTTP